MDLSKDQVLVDSAPIQCLFYPGLSLSFIESSLSPPEIENPSQNNVQCDEMGGRGTKEGRRPGCWHNALGLMRKCPKEGPIPMITYSICKYSAAPVHLHNQWTFIYVAKNKMV